VIDSLILGKSEVDEEEEKSNRNKILEGLGYTPAEQKPSVIRRHNAFVRYMV